MEKKLTFAAIVGILLFVIQSLLLFIPKLALLAAIVQMVLCICGCAAIGIAVVEFVEKTLK